MDAAVADIIKTRVKPIVDEIFDGYVIMGYHTDSSGTRTRIVLHNTGARVRSEGGATGPKDSALYDAMELPVSIARSWGSRE